MIFAFINSFAMASAFGVPISLACLARFWLIVALYEIKVAYGA